MNKQIRISLNKFKQLSLQAITFGIFVALFTLAALFQNRYEIEPIIANISATSVDIALINQKEVQSIKVISLPDRQEYIFDNLDSQINLLEINGLDPETEYDFQIIIDNQKKLGLPSATTLALDSKTFTLPNTIHGDIFNKNQNEYLISTTVNGQNHIAKAKDNTWVLNIPYTAQDNLNLQLIDQNGQFQTEIVEPGLAGTNTLIPSDAITKVYTDENADINSTLQEDDSESLFSKLVPKAFAQSSCKGDAVSIWKVTCEDGTQEVEANDCVQETFNNSHENGYARWVYESCPSNNTAVVEQPWQVKCQNGEVIEENRRNIINQFVATYGDNVTLASNTWSAESCASKGGIHGASTTNSTTSSTTSGSSIHDVARNCNSCQANLQEFNSIYPDRNYSLSKLGTGFSNCVLFWAQPIVYYSERYGINPNLLAAQMTQESRGILNRNIGASGEIGLMQIIPRFHPEYSAQEYHNPDINIHYAAKKLSRDIAANGSEEKALRVYQGGPGALTNPGPNNQEYIRKIMPLYNSAKNSTLNPTSINLPQCSAIKPGVTTASTSTNPACFQPDTRGACADNSCDRKIGESCSKDPDTCVYGASCVNGTCQHYYPHGCPVSGQTVTTTTPSTTVTVVSTYSTNPVRSDGNSTNPVRSGGDSTNPQRTSTTQPLERTAGDSTNPTRSGGESTNPLRSDGDSTNPERTNTTQPLERSEGDSTNPTRSEGDSTNPLRSDGDSTNPQRVEIQEPIPGTWEAEVKPNIGTNPIRTTGDSTNPTRTAGNSTNPTRTEGDSTNPVRTAGDSTNPARSEGDSINPLRSAGDSLPPQRYGTVSNNTIETASNSQGEVINLAASTGGLRTQNTPRNIILDMSGNGDIQAISEMYSDPNSATQAHLFVTTDNRAVSFYESTLAVNQNFDQTLKDYYVIEIFGDGTKDFSTITTTQKQMVIDEILSLSESGDISENLNIFAAYEFGNVRSIDEHSLLDVCTKLLTFSQLTVKCTPTENSLGTGGQLYASSSQRTSNADNTVILNGYTTPGLYRVISSTSEIEQNYLYIDNPAILTSDQSVQLTIELVIDDSKPNQDTIYLAQGLNFVSFPNATGDVMASELILMLNHQGAEVVSISEFNNGLWNTTIMQDSKIFSNDFAIEANKGYVIQANNEAIAIINSDESNLQNEFAYQQGWNLISGGIIPQNNSYDYLNNNSHIKIVSRYEDGFFKDNAVMDNELAGQEFQIRNNESYFVWR